MKDRDHRMLPWRLTIIVGIIAFAAHLAALYFVLPHAALPAAVLSGVVILIEVEHLGVLGSIYALLRRRSRHRP